MKVRKKITIYIIIITSIFIIFSNIVFQKFFSNYLVKQEDAQVNSISGSIGSFLYERKFKYQGSVSDWGHWDETYDYMNNTNPDYIVKNLIGDTFFNLDVNFIIIVGEDNSVRSKQFYDIENEKFVQFPAKFNENIETVIIASKSKEDTTSILKLGDQFYFVATSEITDSLREKKTNGRMFIGKLIDENIISNLEEMTNSHINLSEPNNATNYIEQEIPLKEGKRFSLHLVKLNKEKETMQVELFIPNTEYKGSSVLISLEKARDLFIGGMKQIKIFLLFYTVIMSLIIFLVFTLLGRYISRPFTKLTNEVRSLDLTKNIIEKLDINGKNEFAFLRMSINNMLTRIEIEQYKVRENEEKLYAILTSVGDGVIAVDRNGKVDFINPIAQQLTGYCQEEAYGKSFETVFQIINEYTREMTESPVQKVFQTEETNELADHTILISKDGLERAIEDSAAPIKDRFGKLIGVVLVFRDFSDKKEKLSQIEYLSYHDQLTCLYNRRFLKKN